MSGEGFEPTVAWLGSTALKAVGNQRAIRVDANGRLEIVAAAGAPLNAVIYGLAGDGATPVAFPQYAFAPQQGDGWRQTITNVSQTLGPFTAAIHYHVVVSSDCWVRVGDDPAGGTPVGAALVGTNIGQGDFPLRAGVYLFVFTATTRWISFIRDSADGVIMIGRAEA